MVLVFSTTTFRILSVLLYSQTAQLVGIRACGKYEEYSHSQFSSSPPKLSSFSFVTREDDDDDFKREQQKRDVVAMASSLLLLSFFLSFFLSSAQQNDDSAINHHRRSSRTVHHFGKTSAWRTNFNTYDSYSGVERGHREEALFTRRRFKRRILE